MANGRPEGLNAHTDQHGRLCFTASNVDAIYYIDGQLHALGSWQRDEDGMPVFRTHLPVNRTGALVVEG